MQLEIPRGLASANPVPEDETEDEKEVAAAAHPSAQAAGAPWVLVKKNGTVEAVDSDVRSADMAACKTFRSRALIPTSRLLNCQHWRYPLRWPRPSREKPTVTTIDTGVCIS